MGEDTTKELDSKETEPKENEPKVEGQIVFHLVS